MKKSYNEEELKQLANKTFDQYPNAKQAFATVDGNVFLAKNRAELHAGSKGRVLTFDRPLAEEAPAEKTVAPKADEQIKAIKEATTLAALESFKDDKRATVVKAYESKLAELTASKQE